VYHVEPGDAVRAGDRFGIVKFGSRMDVHVPPSIQVDARVGDKVRAGETILGALPPPVESETDVSADVSVDAPPASDAATQP